MLIVYRKFSKQHILKRRSNKCLFLFPKFNVYSIQVLETGYISASSLESARRIIVRIIRGVGTVRVVLKPNFWFTSKPNDVRMGKGKGENSELVLPVKAGSILFEFFNVPVDILNIVLSQLRFKLPLKVRLFSKT